jgi:hypothetical protein
LPTISKPFVSDDYDVLYRVVVQKDFFIKGFFRPLSDFTIYLCYLIGGLDVEVYNSFNLLIHASSSFILYRLCIVSDLFKNDIKYFMAWTSSLIFLIYPFHTESIVWMVGRASSLSSFFGFLGLLIFFSRIQKKWKYFLVCTCYFIGSASYETILPLPAILLALTYQPKKPWKEYVPLAVSLTFTLLLHIIVRYWVAGSLTGDYGQKIFAPTALTYTINIFKVIGRLFLPPAENSLLLSILFILLIVLLIKHSFYLLKNSIEYKLTFFKLLSALVLSSIIPIMFGISTRTEEGNRLIYFTSFFFAIWLALIISLIRRQRIKYSALGFISLYFLFFLFQSNVSWYTAGKITTQIIDELKDKQRYHTSIGLINVPQEYNGAFIFRVGFSQALLMNNIDTSRIKLLRTMTTEEANKTKSIIDLQKSGSSVFIAPNTFILADSLITAIQPYTSDSLFFYKKNFNKLLYWNKKELVSVD